MDSTPKKEQETEADDITDLEFRHLHVSQHLYKRTIEGSPMIVGVRKRTDLKTTPDIFRSTSGGTGDEVNGSLFPYYISPTSTPSKEPSNSSSPQTPEVASPTRTPITTGKKSPEKVFVITSGAEKGTQHKTTPGHQENAQRTALLSGGDGKEGCLCRPDMKHALVWASSVKVPSEAASMADILRCPFYILTLLLFLTHRA